MYTTIIGMDVTLSSGDMSKETSFGSRTVEEWIGYDNYIKSVAETLPKDKYIEGLAPREYGTKINYSLSEFDFMSTHLRQLSAALYETAALIHAKVKVGHELSKLLHYPSLLRVFKDTTTADGSPVIFLPSYLYFDSMILHTFDEFLMYKKGVKDKQHFWESAKNLEKIYSNEYDAYFDDLTKDKSASWAARDVKPAEGPVLSWGGISSRSTPGYEARLRFMLYDKLMYNELFSYILKTCKNGGVVNALGIAHKDQIGHNISIVFWQKGDVLQCGIYDPIYFVRDDDNSNSTYSMPLASVYVTLKLLAKEHGFGINIINLSKFCYNTGKGVSCLQYYMNAEYCSVYSMYFFLMLAKNDFDCDITSLRSAVMDTYIVPPARLTRNRGNIEYTNKFTLVTMSFILTVLTLASDRADILDDIHLKYKNMYEKHGIEILEPTIKELLDEKRKTMGDGARARSGGYRKSRKRARRYRRTHKRLSL